MTTVTFLLHQEVTYHELEAICEIKALAWNYPLDTHRSWILDNLRPFDIHVLLEENGLIMAYANLINLNAFDENGNSLETIGIGNVCARIKRKGYGSQLLEAVINYIEINKSVAILYCKEDKIDFYLRKNFKVEKANSDKSFLMSFNTSGNNIEYDGERF